MYSHLLFTNTHIIHLRACIYMHTCTPTYVYIYIHIYANTYVYMCSNITQISAQRCVLESKVYSKKYSEAVASFVEELVIRRELSDNFCHYNEQYDSLKGCAKWAQDSLEVCFFGYTTHMHTP